MDNHFVMNNSNGDFLYQLFYVLAFLVAYSIIIYEGYRRKFPIVKWILILACIRLFVVIGTKIFSFSPEEWSIMFQTRAFYPNPEKTMFGGLLLGVAGYFIASRLLKFRNFAWDTVAIAFPVAVSIQTLGCFFYGCCFGTPSTLPWAIQYPVMSLPHYHQFESGLLAYNDLYSLPVHPVQLYQCLGGILVVILVIKFRKYWKAQGSILLSSIILFAVTRMVIEFFRDPLSNKTGGEMLWILKQVQWQYLTVAVLATLILIWREKTFKVKLLTSSIVQPTGLRIQIGLLLSLILIFLVLRNWFTLPEIIALNIALLPAVLFMGFEIYKITASYKLRWVYVCLLIFPLFLMSQTLPQTQIDTSITKSYKTYHTIGVGYATGNYTDNRTNYTGRGCDMISNTEYFSQRYNALGGGYSFTREDPNSLAITKYGVNILFGSYEQIRQSDNLKNKYSLWEINPYIKYDTRWIGIGGGLHLGNLYYTAGDLRRETTGIPTKGFFSTPIFPQFNFRLGIQKIFFFDFHIADQFPASSPGMAFQTGVGTGFGLSNGFNLRTGFSFLEEQGYYVSAYIPIDNLIVLEPLFLWTGKDVKSQYSTNLPESQFSFAISWRFGHK